MRQALSRYVSFFVLSLSIAIVAGCGDESDTYQENQFSIIEPANGSYFTKDSPPESFRIEAVGDTSVESSEIMLNGKDVTALFNAGGSSGSGRGIDLEAYLVNGKNLITVKNLPAITQSVFTYDSAGPELSITSVEEREGEIAVTGFVTDPGGVNGLYVNEMNVDLAITPLEGRGSRGDFNVLLSSLVPVNKFVSTDDNGYTSTIRYARRDHEFLPAVAARLNEGGIKLLEGELNNILQNTDIEGFITAQNPIVDSDFMLGNTKVSSLKVDITDLRWGEATNMQIDALNDNGGIKIRATFENFVGGIKFSPEFDVIKNVFPVPSTDYNPKLSIAKMELETTARISMVDGRASIGLADTRVDLQGIDIDLKHMTNRLGLETAMNQVINLVNEGLEKTLTPLFIGITEKAVLPVVDQFVKYIPLKVGVDVGIMGDSMSSILAPSTLETAYNGIYLDTGVALKAKEVKRPDLGSIYVADDNGDEIPLPELDVLTPDGREYDVAAILGSNFMNQVFLALHESGVLDISITKGEDGTLSINDQELLKEILGPGDALRITLNTMHAPTIIFGGNDITLVSLLIDDAYLNVETRIQGQSEFVPLLAADLTIKVALDVGVNEDSSLDLAIIGVPEIRANKLYDFSLLDGLDAATLNRMINGLVLPLLPVLADGLSTIQLPAIAGFKVLPEGIWLDEEEAYLAIALSLVHSNESDVADEPTIDISIGGENLGDMLGGGGLNLEAVTEGLALSAGGLMSGGLKLEPNLKERALTVYLSGDDPELASLQFRLCVDGGICSIWSERDKWTLANLKPGNHSIDVCSRTTLLKKACETLKFSITGESGVPGTSGTPSLPSIPGVPTLDQLTLYRAASGDN